MLRSISSVFALGLIALIAALPARSQTYNNYPPYTAYSAGSTTAGNNHSGVINSSTAPQLVFQAIPYGTALTQRNGCTIVNNGTHNMFVSEGVAGGATQAQSVLLAPGQAYFCAQGNVALQGEVDIRGTQGDGFYAAQY